jgi:endonuclease YncB( thermonuclease family)
MNLLKTAVVFVALTSHIFSQNVSIKEVLDANLFKLSDGRIVKLAGVDAPSDSSSIPYLRIVASNAKEFMNRYSKTQLKLDSVAADDRNRYILVILSKQYTLQDVCLNEVFLRNGFARFFDNTKSFNTAELIKAQDNAFKYDIGIWKFFTPTRKDTLDYMLAKSSLVSVIQPDSTKLDNSYNQTPTVVKVAFELLAGSGVTFLSTVAGAGIVAGLTKGDGWVALGGGILGFGVGYFIGFPTMIYIVAKGENPNLNFWENLGCSWGLTLVNGLIASQIKEHNHPMHAIAWLSPVIGSLLYVHVLAPQTPNRNNSLLVPDKKISSFKDFRDSQTTRLELFRINF